MPRLSCRLGGGETMFEAAYRPELSEGDVVFTDYQLVAANRR